MDIYKIKSLAEWLLESEELILPAYQRPYQWDESLVTAFATDFLRTDESLPNDIGLLVLEYENDDKKALRVADGQQRLLTFSLLLEATKEEILPSSRLKRLCESACRNVESEYRIEAVRRLLERIIPANERSGLRTRLLETQATVVKRPANDIENIERLFEDANTAGRLLTGWQILKAHHYGRIVTAKSDANNTLKALEALTAAEVVHALKSDANDTLKALEDWRLGRRTAKEVFEDDGLHDGPPLRKMPLDRIVDGHAWTTFGQGIIAAIFGLLAGERNAWWCGTLEKTEAHLDPLEPYYGWTDDVPEECSPSRKWRADRPLDFASGMGFFSMIARLEKEVHDYIGQIPRLKKSVEALSMTDDVMLTLDEGGVRLADNHPRTPAALVVTAALIFLTLVYRLRDALEKDEVTKGYDWDGFVQRAETQVKVIGFAPTVQDSCHLDSSKGNDALVLFATALCWSDRFRGKKATLERGDAEVLLKVLLVQLFNASCTSRWDTHFRSLLMRPAIDAARENRHVASAWWLFRSRVRPNESGSRKNEPEAADLHQTYLGAWIRLLRELENSLNGVSNETKILCALAAHVRRTLEDVVPEDCL